LPETDDWRPRLRVEVFLSTRSAGECHYYTGRAQRTITSRSSDGAVILEVEDLGIEAQLDVFCNPPQMVIVNGRRAKEGDYTYDPTRQMLETRLVGARL